MAMPPAISAMLAAELMSIMSYPFVIVVVQGQTDNVSLWKEDQYSLVGVSGLISLPDQAQTDKHMYP